LCANSLFSALTQLFGQQEGNPACKLLCVSYRDCVTSHPPAHNSVHLSH